MQLSSRASPSSTPPTSTATARNGSARPSAVVGTASYWPPSSAAPSTAPRPEPAPTTCVRPWSEACGSSEPTTSTSISCIRRIRSTPIADTLGALDELIEAGKVREIGCSNFDAGQLREAAAAADASGGHRFVSVQNHYNLLHRSDEEEVLPECRREDLAYLPYFPLASGLLSGKYAAGEAPPPGTRLDRWGGERAKGVMTARNFGVIDALDGWAADHGHSVLELAVAWLLADPIIPSVIAGATSPEQVRANATAGSWRLDPVQRSEIDSLALPA